MSQKEEKKIVSILQEILGNNFKFKSLDDFIGNFFKLHNNTKNLTLENQKQLKNKICDILFQMKDKTNGLLPKEIQKLLQIFFKKLQTIEIIRSFEYELAIDVIFQNFYIFLIKHLNLDFFFCCGKFHF